MPKSSRRPAPKKTRKTAAAARRASKINETIFTGAQLQRIWEIHGRLSRRERFNAKRLADELEVSPLTIKRTIETMRVRLGMPIKWDSSARTYTCDDDCETLPMLRLDAQEALALAVAGRLFNRWNGSPFGRILDSMLKKIAPVFGGAVSVAVESVEQAFSQPGGLADDEGLEYFFPALEAILERKVLRIDYVKRGATAAEPRTAHPLHLAELRQGWVLLAHDPGRRAIRQFVLSRIEGFATTGATFEPPAKFDAREYLAGTLGAFAGTEEYEVRLALDAHAAFYARERPWHASQRLAERPDGGVEMTLRINHLIDAKNAVLPWGEHVEVLSPPELRAQVRTSLAKALEKYA